jgi:hypothetical protein
MELGCGARPPERVWGELANARRTWGIQTFYNVADSVGTSVKDLEDFVRAMPPECEGTVHRCFINAHQINSRTMHSLKCLNAIAALGIESYNLLHKVGKKPSTVEINNGAIRQLEEASIPMALSFVLGLPGESPQTLESTARYIEHLVEEYSMVTSLEVSPLTVTTGSRAYRDLMSRTGDHYRQFCPPYDIVDMSERYFECCCGISRGQALEAIADLAEEIHHKRPNLRVDVKGLSVEEGGRYFSRGLAATEYARHPNEA